MSASRTLPPDSVIVTSTIWTGVFLGIGVIGSLDEIALHQLLQWHNFYVHADQFWRIFSDGAFHLFTVALLVLGAGRLWAQRHHLSTLESSRPLWAGVLLGAGGFQLFDGIVNHKILQLHPIREGVENIWIYDLVRNVLAALVFLAGWFLWRSLRRENAAAPLGAGHAESPDGNQAA